MEQANAAISASSPVMISSMPPEILLIIMSQLPVRDIALLRTLNHTLYATIATNELFICLQRIDYETARLDNEFDGANIVGVSVSAGLRSFVATYGRSQGCLKCRTQPEYHIAMLSDMLADLYHTLNPGASTSLRRARAFAYWILSIDLWLQTGDFPMTKSCGTAVYHEVLETLLDALDSTLPIDDRYTKLTAYLGSWVRGGASRTQIGIMFEDMLRAPILPKLDIEWCHTACKHGEDRPLLPVIQPSRIEKQLCVSRDSAESYYRRVLGFRGAWAARTAAN